MAFASLGADLLNPQVLTKVVSRIAANHNSIVDYFGFGPGGANTAHMGEGRYGVYHVYNNSRKVAKGKAPGAAAGRRGPQGMKAVQFTFPRAHDSVTLPAEMIHNLGRIDDPARRDEAGEQMIARQTKTLGEMLGNFRAALTCGMIRDSLYAKLSGDDWYLSFTQPASDWMKINFNMPAGNKDQLDMLGDGDILTTSWANPAANIPDQLGKVNAAFQQLYGGRLETVMLPFSSWSYVLQNEFVRATHGSSNAPFVEFSRSEETGPDGRKKNIHKARLNAMPGVEFHITDEGLELGAENAETYQKVIPDNEAVFIGASPSDKVYEMREGSEPIAEYDGGPIQTRAGVHTWSVTRSNPTATDILALDNCLPVNTIPQSIAAATVVF